ncbi:MAG: hypothetical protein JWL67_2537 [Solirubrobacterales bacterium]|jgi:hypothetical protein|nr:hypothetical protein [Solirubrobacterales bacterium]
MDRTKNARNIAIVVAIALAVYLLPGGGRAASTFESALWVAFGVGIAYFGLRMYREHRMRLDGLGDRHRALLYGGVALGVFLYAARRRLWETGSGELLWFVLAGCVVYALLEVFRHSRSY